MLSVEGLAKTLGAAKCLMKLLSICVKGTTGITKSFPPFVPTVGKLSSFPLRWSIKGWSNQEQVVWRMCWHCVTAIAGSAARGVSCWLETEAFCFPIDFAMDSSQTSADLTCSYLAARRAK